MTKRMGAPLKRDSKLLTTGITQALEERYETFATATFTTKTNLKRLALEYVIAEIDAGRLAVRRSGGETHITKVPLPEQQESA